MSTPVDSRFDTRSNTRCPNTRCLGAVGEVAVERYLTAQGYTMVVRNFSWRGGELDIVAARGEVIAFVEVKLRTHSFMTMADLVPPAKQRKVIKTARYFIAKQQLTDRSYRYDVALVDAHGTVTYYEDAFTGGCDDIW